MLDFRLTYLMCLTIATTISIRQVHGSEAPAQSEQKAAKVDKGEKKKKKDKGDKSKQSHSTEEAPKNPSEFKPSPDYVHNWVPTPSVEGFDLVSGSRVNFGSEKGYVYITVFIASWCEPCQKIIETIQRLEKTFAPRFTRVLYVFAHDTPDDALGFTKEYHLSQAILANMDLLKTFHNPELPTLYVGDRRGWLAMRKQSATIQNIAEIEEWLQWVTAL